MNHSESIKIITSSLVKAQSEMGIAKKGEENPFFKSKYADLPEVIRVCKEPLNKHGIVLLQPVDGDVVKTYLLHESGEWLSSEGTKILNNKPNDPQAQGSAITYARRYDLMSMLGIPADDDDGERAVNRENQTITKPIKPTKVITRSADTAWKGTPITPNQKVAVVKIAQIKGDAITYDDLATWTSGQASDYIGNKGDGGYYKMKERQEEAHMKEVEKNRKEAEELLLS